MSSNQNNELLKEKFIKYKESKDIDIRNELVEDYLYLVNAMFLGCAGTRVIASEEPEYLQLLGRYVGLCTAAGGKIVYAFQQRNDQSFGPTSC